MLMSGRESAPGGLAFYHLIDNHDDTLLSRAKKGWG